MEPKRVGDSSVMMAEVMLPEDANPSGNVHGGVIMKHIDTTAYVVACRHARCNVVTASVDRLDFLKPVFVGDLLVLKGSMNMAGKSSMEVGVRVEAENITTGEVRHTASAYLTMVALGQDGKPLAIPLLIPETDEEKRRNTEARTRREARLAAKKRQARPVQSAQ